MFPPRLFDGVLSCGRNFGIADTDCVLSPTLVTHHRNLVATKAEDRSRWEDFLHDIDVAEEHLGWDFLLTRREWLTV